MDGKGWTAANDLCQSDKVVSYSGELLEVENISIVAGPTPVYNFEVEGTHTYYVSGANVLVHNMCAAEGGLKKIGTPGSSKDIRVVTGGVDAAEEMFQTLTRNATKVTRKADGTIVAEMANGGYITYRASSKSGPPTIDFNNIPNTPRKIKFK